METINNVVDFFRDFATDHPQINSFSVGQELQLDIEKIEYFPKMFVIIGPVEYLNPGVIANFQVYIIDKPINQGLDVVSDTFQIGTDLIYHLKYSQALNIASQIGFVPFDNLHDNVLRGWLLDVPISTNFIATNCHLLPIEEETIFDETFDITFE